MHEIAEVSQERNLDILFQLMTFIMLLVEFVATVSQQDLGLPVVGSVAPVSSLAYRDLIVINMFAEGTVWSRGRWHTSIDAFLSAEACLLDPQICCVKRAREETVVVIRADPEVPCRAILQVLTACRSRGYERIEFFVLRTLHT